MKEPKKILRSKSTNPKESKSVKAKLQKLIPKHKKSLSMTKAQINEKLGKLHAKHLKSFDVDQLWDVTRETLYLKIALGLLKKYRKENLNELNEYGMQNDGAFQFKIGNIYPNSVLITAENYKSSVRLVQDFVAEVSPYLNEAEQMLFKVAICEEHFRVDEE